jgi:hypothetical protein
MSDNIIVAVIYQEKARFVVNVMKNEISIFARWFLMGSQHGSRRSSRYRASACFNGDRVVSEQIQCGRKNDQLTQRGSVGKIKRIPGRPSMTFENRTWFFTNDSSSRDADQAHSPGFEFLLV